MARRGRSSSPRAEPRKRRAPREHMVIYGRNAVREALRGRRRVHRVFATEAAARETWNGAPVVIEDAAAIERRCGSDGHQGVCAEVDPYPYADAAELLAVPDALIVALDEVTDPQNLGAICRTAEAVGATGVVIPEHRSALVTPAVCKASAGAVEHLRVAIVRNLADFLGEAKATDAWCYGAAAGARTRYDQPDWRGRAVLVLGAEGKGLRPRVADACDDLISLPMRGRIASLNVSATAAAILYEILQQRLDTST
jgi:23S rRNA (guanosine2251-2'-O)-methyltransferase